MSGIFLNILGNTYGTSIPIDYSLANARLSALAHDGTNIGLYSTVGSIKGHYTNSPLASTPETVPKGAMWSPDGSILITIGSGTDLLRRYDAGEPVAATTYTQMANVTCLYACAAANANAGTFNTSTQDATPNALYVTQDGLTIYVLGQQQDRVNQYNLSTAWDLTTCSFYGFFTSTDTAPFGITFSLDGQYMFLVGQTGDLLYQYILSTPFDVTTASFYRSRQLAVYDATPYQVTVAPDGTSFILYGTTGQDYTRFVMSTPFDVSTGSPNYTSVTGYSGAGAFTTSQDGCVVQQTKVASDQFTASLGIGGFYIQDFVAENSLRAACFSSDGLKLFCIGATNDTLYQFTLPSAYSTYNVTLSGSRSVSAQVTAPTIGGLTINGDGTRIYIVQDATPDVIYWWDLGTANDINGTFTLGGSQNSFPYAGGTAPQINAGIRFNNDGTYFYILSNGSGGFDTLKQYACSTAYDLSSISLVTEIDMLNNGNCFPTGFCFSPDGLNVYVGDYASNLDVIYRFVLSTPWMISTASLDTSNAFSFTNMSNQFLPYHANEIPSTGQLEIFVADIGSVAAYGVPALRILTNNFPYTTER